MLSSNMIYNISRNWNHCHDCGEPRRYVDKTKEQAYWEQIIDHLYRNYTGSMLGHSVLYKVSGGGGSRRESANRSLHANGGRGEEHLHQRSERAAKGS